VQVMATFQSMQSKKSREASSQPKSSKQAPIVVSDDEQDKALLKLNKDNL
jgi:hypothetical protein